MQKPSCKTIFRQRILDEIFPSSRADRFFAALFGDASEGAYDISLAYAGEKEDQIRFRISAQTAPRKVPGVQPDLRPARGVHAAPGD